MEGVLAFCILWSVLLPLLLLSLCFAVLLSLSLLAWLLSSLALLCVRYGSSLLARCPALLRQRFVFHYISCSFQNYF